MTKEPEENDTDTDSDDNDDDFEVVTLKRLSSSPTLRTNKLVCSSLSSLTV